MKWQDLLRRPAQKRGELQTGPRPTIQIEAADPPGYGPQGFMAQRPPEPAPQPVQVRMKEQVMGGRCAAREHL